MHLGRSGRRRERHPRLQLLRDLLATSVAQDGFASLVAVLGISIILLVVFAGLASVQIAGKTVGTQLRYQGHALNVAEAGATEGLAWFQRQTVQPVSAFSPQRNLAATPPVNDTDDTAIGLVRTFSISTAANVWGRYEVRTPSAIDVTTQRGKTGTGLIWQFDATGLVFVDKNNNGRMDYTDTNGNGVYDLGEPGEVVARKVMRAEARRLSVVLPGGNAAIQGSTCSSVDLTASASQVRVLGSSAGVGVACKSGTGAPRTTGATVTGNPATQSSVNPYNDAITSVFGVSQDELVSMANVKAANVAGLPNPLPSMALMVVQGDATFTTTTPLVGSGILVVFGALTVPAGSSFNGIIYVTGNYTQSAPSQVRGAVVGKAGIVLQGGGDVSELDWDNVIVQQTRNSLGGYRFSRTTYVTP